MQNLTFKTTHTLAEKINPVDSTEIPLLEFNPEAEIPAEILAIPGNKLVSSLWVRELIVTSYISSLPEIPLPDIPDSATESERTSLALKALWDSPRFDLTCWISLGAEDSFKVGSLPLRNSSGYPYLRQKLLDLFTDALMLELGSGSLISISIEDAGWGLPQAEDQISVYGSYVYEHQLISLSASSNSSLTANDLLYASQL